MKKVRAILPVLVLALMMGTLSACGGVGTTLESPEGEVPNSTVSDPIVDEGEGRMLVYDDHGVRIYASSVMFVPNSSEESAWIYIYYKIVNTNDKQVAIVIDDLMVNGHAHQYSDMLVANPNSAMTDNSTFSTIRIVAKFTDLNVVQREDGQYEFDRSIAYTVTGEFSWFLRDDWPKGTFTLTIPANFPRDTFRTDEVWTSTR
ncbi:MAG: hypothetical protein FWG15_07315 [Propionibacteriaceae bacterium]|nr:hypothetical protein [Propionibacteriaceae bacterium]